MTELTEPNAELLTLEDLAALLSHTDQLPLRTALKLTEVIRTDPRFADQVEVLQTMARQAGIGLDREDWPEAALHCHRDLERLLATEGWEHPAEVLDPDGETGVTYRELVHLAEARAGASEDPRLGEIRQRLQRAWAAEREKAAPIQRIVTELLGQGRDAARHMLNQAFVEYERRRTALSA